MKQILVFVLLSVNAALAFGQEKKLVKGQVDSILRKIAAEENPDKRVTAMLSIIITKIEGYAKNTCGSPTMASGQKTVISMPRCSRTLIQPQGIPG